MTIPWRPLLVAAAAVLGVSGGAEAVCTDKKCTDSAALETVRARIAVACNCQAARSHGAYMKCVREVIEVALSDGSLPESCRRGVMRCEAQTVCGRRNAVVCCNPGGKARIVRSGACKGTPCSWLRGVADGCSQDGSCTPVAAPFRTIQQVFAGSCALQTCHSAVARQGGLALDTEDVSYSSLVNQPPTDVQAQDLGLLRVAAGDPSKSFLLRQLRHEGPGTGMPQNAPPLADALITMIEAWIARGAKPTSEECSAGGGVDPELCSGIGALGGGNFKWKPQKALKAPSKRRGIRLYVPKRPVMPGTEWEICYAFRPDWKSIAKKLKYEDGQLPVIKQQEYRMHDGSHHLLMYMYFGTQPEKYPTGFFPCFAGQCLNPGDCPPDSEQSRFPIGGTQVAGTRYVVSYPDGVGIPVLSDKAVLIANLHYTNPFQPAQEIYGEAWLNFEFYRPKEFKVLLDGIFAVNLRDLFVEPFETRTISRIWQPSGLVVRAPTDAAVFQLFGHMHKRGELFQIDFVKGGACSVSGALCGRDDDCSCKPYENECVPGQTCIRGPDAEDTMIYRTTRWDHAPVNEYRRPNFLMVNKDQGLRWTCTHTNGYPNDPTRPPKRCHEGCNSCGWDDATRTCTFTRGVDFGYDAAPRTYKEGDPMPVVFGELADDDMCNMFGYFIPQAAIPQLP